MNSAGRFRQMLLKDDFIVAPGAFDCLSARSAELAGFSAIYMTGMGTSASRLGLPDYGLATMSEMVANASALATVRMSRVPLRFPNTMAVKEIFQRLGAEKWDKLRVEKEAAVS